MTSIVSIQYIRTADVTATATAATAAILLIDCVNDIGVEAVEVSVEKFRYMLRRKMWHEK